VSSFARGAAFAIFLAVFCGDPRVDARPNAPAPSAVQAVDTPANAISTKWAELQGRILADQATLDGCRSGHEPCPAAAQRFLSLVELGRRREGRARIGQINRGVNLSIRPVSDLLSSRSATTANG